MNKPYDLEERLIDFAVDVINVVEVLPNSKASNHIANQQASSWRSHASNRIANGTPSGTSHFGFTDLTSSALIAAMRSAAGEREMANRKVWG